MTTADLIGALAVIAEFAAGGGLGALLFLALTFPSRKDRP